MARDVGRKVAIRLRTDCEQRKCKQSGALQNPTSGHGVVLDTAPSESSKHPNTVAGLKNKSDIGTKDVNGKSRLVS